MITENGIADSIKMLTLLMYITCNCACEVERGVLRIEP